MSHLDIDISPTYSPAERYHFANACNLFYSICITLIVKRGTIMNSMQKAIGLILIILLSSCAEIFHRTSEQAFESGLTLFNSARYGEAAPYFEKAVVADPDFGKAYLYLGRCYLNLGKFREAVQPLRTAFNLEPAQSRNEIINLLLDAFLGAGMTSFRKGDYLDALDMYREAIKLSPNSIEAYLGLAKAFAKKGDISNALLSILDAMKIHPDNSALQDLYMEFLPE